MLPNLRQWVGWYIKGKPNAGSADIKLLREKYPDNNVSIESSALVVYGEKEM